MHTLFSKPCHVVGKPVFDHLPLDYIDEWFGTNPPEQLLQMYRTFGRGTLGDFFKFGYVFEVVNLKSWQNMFPVYPEEVPDTEVCELIGAYSRMGVGYGRSGHYYVLDFDTHTYHTSLDLEQVLQQAALRRELEGITSTPYFVSASAVSASWDVRLGRHFFGKFRNADIRGMPSRMSLTSYCSYTLLLDMAGRFVASMRSEGLMQPDEKAQLTISFDYDLAYAPENVFKTLTDIAGEDFQVLGRRH